MSLPSLDAIELTLTAYSGFNYPANGQIVAILGDGTTIGGNAVLQQSALPFRQAQISWFADDAAEAESIRALYETKEEVTFEDDDEISRGVVVWEFSSAAHGAGGWDCSATLIEMTEPGS